MLILLAQEVLTVVWVAIQHIITGIPFLCIIYAYRSKSVCVLSSPKRVQYTTDAWSKSSVSSLSSKGLVMRMFVCFVLKSWRRSYDVARFRFRQAAREALVLLKWPTWAENLWQTNDLIYVYCYVYWPLARTAIQV